MVCVPGVQEAPLINDALVLANGHERAVKVQDALVGVCVAFSEVERNDALPGENHLEVIQRQTVCTGCFHLRVVLKGVLPKENDVVPKHYVSALHMHGFRQVVYVLVVDLPVDAAIGVNLLLAVRDNVGDNDFVVYHKAHVPCENLVAVRHKVRSVHRDIILFQDALKGVHLIYDVFFFRVHPVKDRLIGFAVEGLVQGRRAAV